MDTLSDASSSVTSSPRSMTPSEVAAVTSLPQNQIKMIGGGVVFIGGIIMVGLIQSSQKTQSTLIKNLTYGRMALHGVMMLIGYSLMVHPNQWDKKYTKVGLGVLILADIAMYFAINYETNN